MICASFVPGHKFGTNLCLILFWRHNSVLNVTPHEKSRSHGFSKKAKTRSSRILLIQTTRVGGRLPTLTNRLIPSRDVLGGV